MRTRVRHLDPYFWHFGGKYHLMHARQDFEQYFAQHAQKICSETCVIQFIAWCIICLSRFGCRFKIAFIILRVYHRKSCTAIYAAKRELRDRNLLQDFIPASVHKYVQSLTVHRISYFYKTYHENISFIPKKNNNEIIPSK